MAIDTENKRAAAIMVSLPFRSMLPQPDGTIDAGDRAEAAFTYRGIIDEGGGPGPSGPAWDWLITARRRHGR